MNKLKHHLVLGELKDFLTGQLIEDNHDERLRQKLARFLVEEKKFEKENITSRIKLTVRAGDKKAVIRVDFKVVIFQKTCIVVKYGPGSLVTRRRPALAASRLVETYQVPFIVVTNGIDAEILDGVSGKVIGKNLLDIPGQSELSAQFDLLAFGEISEERAEKTLP